MPIDVKQASDAELVSRFAAGRDQRAFAEVVRRHGPMVMGAAARVLGNRHDAEDAFQATFLALAAAAGKLRKRAAVAAWLHQTAVRSARSIGRMNARWKRNVTEKSQSTQEAYVQGRHADLRETLDAELARLPEKLRAAIVLCDLEGLSRTAAAERLGIPSSTLANHVADGRKVLRSRLVKRGIGLSVAGLAANLAEFAQASPSLSTAAVDATTTKAVMFAAGTSGAEVAFQQTWSK
jgi:RNA polymerase sigma factor (sigma-70 family)